MRRKILSLLLVVLVVFVQIGCASLEGRYVDNDVPKEIETASGVSYYLTQPTFEIQRKTTKNSKKAEPVYDLVIGTTPDPKRRFEVGINQGWFSSDTFELNLTEDARVESTTGSSADQTARVIASLGVLAAEVAGAVGTGGMTLMVDPDGLPVESGLTKIFREGLGYGLIEREEFDAAKCYIDNLPNGCSKPTGKDYIKIANKLKSKLIETNSDNFKGIKIHIEQLEEIDPTGIPPHEEELISIETKEGEVIKIYDWIEKVDESIVQTKVSIPPAPTVVKEISKIKKELDIAIAETLKNPLNRREMLTKALKFRNAVSLVVEADEIVNNRGLSRLCCS